MSIFSRPYIPEWEIKLWYQEQGGERSATIERRVKSPDAFSAVARVLVEERDDLPPQEALKRVESKQYLGSYADASWPC